MAQLDHIVGMYNAVLTELLPVEEPLLEDRIAKMDQAGRMAKMDALPNVSFSPEPIFMHAFARELQA